MMEALVGALVWSLRADRIVLSTLALLMLFSHYSMSRRCVAVILLLRVVTAPVASDFILLAFMVFRPYLSFEFRSIFPAFFLPDWVSYTYGGPYFRLAFLFGVIIYGLLLMKVCMGAHPPPLRKLRNVPRRSPSSSSRLGTTPPSCSARTRSTYR